MCNNENQVKGKARPLGVGRAAPCPEQRPILLKYNNAQARQVEIAGSFNDWNSESTGMVRVERGRWLRALFLPPGRYEYVFVVDGLCIADPRAESVLNVHGCFNSVLTVPAPVQIQARAQRRFASVPPTSLKLNRRRGCRGNTPRGANGGRHRR